MIGSRMLAEALTALYSDAWDNSPELAGFSYVGEGCSRVVYLGPDNVVYKILQGDYDEANLDEAENYKLIDRKGGLPGGWELAKCRLIGDVLAMEYVEGMHSEWHTYDEPCNESCERLGKCVNDVENEIRRATGLSDIHGENYLLRKDGVKVLIDYSW